MNRLKTSAVVLLLLTVTVSVVFVPVFINTYGNDLSDERDYWQYGADSDNKVTGRQVVDLYYSDGINGSYSESDSFEITEAKESFMRIIDTVFADNESVREHLKGLSDHEMYRYTKVSVLCAVENNPIALNIINISCGSAFEQIEISYEEKTQTVIHFSYQNSNEDGMTEGETADKFLNMDAIMLIATNYYHDKFQLSEDRYYFENGLDWISFGLHQQPKEYDDVYIKDVYIK